MADVTSVASLMIDSVAAKTEKLILIGKHCIVAEVTINANISRSICAAVYLLEFCVVQKFFIFHNDFSFALCPCISLYDTDGKVATTVLKSFFISHLHGQVVQALVVLLLRDRAVFEEGFQGGHLPVVECPALFLRGQGLPRCVVRCVHRATVLPAGGIVPCRCAGFKSRHKIAGYSVEKRRKIRTQTAQIPVKVAGKSAQILHRDRVKSPEISLKAG